MTTEQTVARIIVVVGAIILIIDGLLLLSTGVNTDLTMALQGIGAITLIIGLILTSIANRRAKDA